MLRVWVVSGVIVAVIVAAVLYLTADPPAEGRRPALRPVGKSVEEWEVRLYLQLWPEIDLILKRTLSEYLRQRTPEFEPSLNAEGLVSDFLFRRSLTMDDWNRLRQRVENAVTLARLRDRWPEEEERIRETVRQKEELLAEASGATKDSLAKDVAAARAALDRGPPPIDPGELELLKSFWKDLDRLVPSLGPEPVRR